MVARVVIVLRARYREKGCKHPLFAAWSGSAGLSDAPHCSHNGHESLS